MERFMPGAPPDMTLMPQAAVLEADHVSIVELPDAMLAGEAEKELMIGFATVTVVALGTERYTVSVIVPP